MNRHSELLKIKHKRRCHHWQWLCSLWQRQQTAKWNSATLSLSHVAQCVTMCTAGKAYVNIVYSSTAGTMLLVTAFFNFILSKKTNTKSHKRPQDGHSDQGLTTVCVTEGAPSDTNFSFLHTGTGRRGGILTVTTRDRCLGPGERGESVEAMLELEQAAAPKERDRERGRWKEKRLIFFRRQEEPVEREMEEMYYSEPDTTSDTAPMITDWTSRCAQTELLTDITQRRAWATCSERLWRAGATKKATMKCLSSQIRRLLNIYTWSVIRHCVFYVARRQEYEDYLIFFFTEYFTDF